MARRRTSGLRVAVAGATGLVGRALLSTLADDARASALHAVVRRPPAPALPGRVQLLLIDPLTLAAPGAPQLPPIDVAFCALGTTISQAGSQAAFRAVDVDAVLAFGLAARAAGAQALGIVSAAGADPHSRVFYNRAKGEAEAGLMAQGWPHLVIARPSLLLGERGRLGQPARTAERWAQAVLPAFGRLVPARLRPIAADQVARALIQAVISPRGPAEHSPGPAHGPRTEVLENDTLLQVDPGQG